MGRQPYVLMKAEKVYVHFNLKAKDYLMAMLRLSLEGLEYEVPEEDEELEELLHSVLYKSGEPD